MARARSTPPASGETRTGIPEVLLRQIVDDDGGRGEEVVDRHVEEALDLPGVKIHREHPVAARGGDEVRHELGRDGHASHHLAVLAAVAVVREDRGDAPGRRALERVHHHQELHQVVVDGRARRLDHEHVLAADVLVDLDVHLAVREARDVGIAQRARAAYLAISSARGRFAFPENSLSP